MKIFHRTFCTLIGIGVFIFLILGCENNSQDCESSFNSSTNTYVSFSPMLAPFSVKISSKGIAISGDKEFKLPWGSIKFGLAASVGSPEIPDHEISIIIKRGKSQKEYKIINTDKATVSLNLINCQQQIEYSNKQITIDISNCSVKEIQFLVNSTPYNENLDIKSKQFKVITKSVSLHSSANSKSHIIAEIPKDEIVKYLLNRELDSINNHSGYWLEICYKDQKGWAWGWDMVKI